MKALNDKFTELHVVCTDFFSISHSFRIALLRITWGETLPIGQVEKITYCLGQWRTTTYS